VFGQGLFDRVTNGDSKDKDDASTNGTTTTPSSATSGSGFVFGQNLSDRVTNQQVAAEEQNNESNDNTEQSEPGPSAAPTLFQNSTEQQSVTDQEPEVFGAAGHAALAHLNNSDVVVSTGEENERNVLHINCKLYIYDKETSNWIERGQGQLRLNDPAREADGKSRIIIRTSGTLRLLLNTQIWEGLDLKVASDRKCLRLIAPDELNDHKMHVFMIKCPSQDDASKLNREIRMRLETLKRAAKEEEKLVTISVPVPDESHRTTKRVIPEESEDGRASNPDSSTPTSKKAHLD
jgi:Ran-binding protein 3